MTKNLFIISFLSVFTIVWSTPLAIAHDGSGPHIHLPNAVPEHTPASPTQDENRETPAVPEHTPRRVIVSPTQDANGSIRILLSSGSESMDIDFSLSSGSELEFMDPIIQDANGDMRLTMYDEHGTPYMLVIPGACLDHFSACDDEHGTPYMVDTPPDANRYARNSSSLGSGRGSDNDDGCVTAYGKTTCCPNGLVVCNVYSPGGSISSNSETDCDLGDLILSGGVGYAVSSQVGSGSGKTAAGIAAALLSAKALCGQ